jgi:NADPH-dependent 2,4-dienoyl-CoA reductase/sulfur reductase-like enzyme
MTVRYGLLIVGGGPAGMAAARAFRAAGDDRPVALVSDEWRMPYNRPPLSKELFRAEIDESELPLESEAWLEQQRVGLVGGRAVALDAGAHQVTLSGGRRLDYETCLLATGAEPVRLPLPGADHPAVRTLRSLEDLRELKRRLDPDAPVAVIGSGFIGCEIAASLRMLGHPVALISDETAPNVGRLGDEAAARIGEWLRAMGLELRLGHAVDAIARRDGELCVRSGETEVAARIVIMAAGVAPRAELAAFAGAELDRGAVAADAGLRTSLPDVLAAGDVCAAVNVAAGRRLHVEHWGDALGQGELAGRRAAGEDVQWAQVPGFWSMIGEHTLKYAAWGDGFTDTRRETTPAGGFTVSYGRDGRHAGVLAHRADATYDRGRELIAEGAPWP